MRRIFAHGAVSIVTSLCMSGPLVASESEMLNLSLENLLNLTVSTASRSAETVDKAPATVYLITEQDIVRNGYYTLSEVLENVPGMNPIELGFFSFGGVRGFLGNFSQTLLLIDGREVQNLIAAETFISKQFATNNIHQIEIINGPGSALYGANALLGVINIKTKTGSMAYRGAKVDVELGSEQTRGVSLIAGKEFGDLSVALYARHHQSDNWDFSSFVQDPVKYSEGSPTVLQQSHNIQTTGYLNHSQVKNISLRLDYKNFWLGLEKFRLENGKGLENVALNYHDQDDHRAFDLFYAGWADQLTDNIHLSVDLSHYKEKFWGLNYTFDQETFDELVALGRDESALISPEEVELHFTSVYSQQASSGSTRNRVDVKLDTQLPYDWDLIFGLNYDEQDVMGIASSNLNIVPEFNQQVSDDNPLRRPFYASDESSLYAQLRRSFFDDNLTLTLGGRMDDHSIYGRITSLRSGLVYSYDESTSFKLLFGEAFREPNIFEQGAQNPPDVPPNLDLQPAEITTYELSINQVFGKYLTAQAVYFHNTVESLIVPVDTYNFGNSGDEVKSDGIEVMTRYEYEAWSGDVAYSYVKTDGAVVAGQQVKNLNVPQHRLSVGVNYQWSDQFRTNLRANWYDYIEAEHGNPSVDEVISIGSVLKLDANLNWQHTVFNGHKLTLTAGIKNLLDETWYQPNVRNGGPKQFLQPGRQLMSRISLEF